MAAAINANYPVPVVVNGFSCKNCTDVSNAKKHIDPAHPKDGPYGINAKNDPSQQSVTFGGSLSGLNNAKRADGSTTGDVSEPAGSASEAGSQVDISA